MDRAGNRLCGGTNGVGFFSRRLYWWGPHKEKGRGSPRENLDAEANEKRKGITKGKPFCLGAWGQTPTGKGVGRDRPERSEGKLDPGGIPGKREVPKAPCPVPLKKKILKTSKKGHLRKRPKGITSKNEKLRWKTPKNAKREKKPKNPETHSAKTPSKGHQITWTTWGSFGRGYDLNISKPLSSILGTCLGGPGSLAEFIGAMPWWPALVSGPYLFARASPSRGPVAVRWKNRSLSASAPNSNPFPLGCSVPGWPRLLVPLS